MFHYTISQWSELVDLSALIHIFTKPQVALSSTELTSSSAMTERPCDACSSTMNI